MNNDYFIKRHSELWERQNKQIKNLLIFGLIAAYILLANILKPYAQRIDDIQEQTTRLTLEASSIEETITSIDQLEDTLQTVKTSISNRPWREEKEKLIRKYARMNAEGSPDWEQYQEEADKTVSQIGMMVLDLVNRPFEAFIADEHLGRVMPRLANELNDLPGVVDDWTQNNKGKRWYVTRDQKEATVQALSSDLDYQLNIISNAIDSEQPNLENKRKDLKAQIEALVEMKVAEKQKLPEKLDAEMKKILPKWIIGIITAEQLMLYPFLIIGFVIYTFVIAFDLARHYRGMATELDIPDEDVSALSSIWTLTYRGRIGTLKTAGIYIGFIVLMWYFFENGFVIYRKYQNTESEMLVNSAVQNIALWVGRLVLLSVLIATIKKILGEKMRSTS
jgi:Fe2+ transport system protein B